MYYEDYDLSMQNSNRLSLPYLVKCKNFEQAQAFCDDLTKLGFDKVCGLGVGYFVVLVNLEVKRFGGIAIPANYSNCGQYTLEEFNQQILHPYVNSLSNGI